MKISENEFNATQDMIHRVEKWVKESKVTKAKLTGIQKRIDELDEEFRYDADVEDIFYQLYELQAIVYHLDGQKKKAQEFAQKALDSMKKTQRPSSKLTLIIATGNQVKNDGLNFIDDSLESDSVDTKNDTLFFQRSTNTVFWLSFLTLNLYNIYWVYRQWRNIRDSSGEKMRPFGRAFFQIFYIHQLLSRIVGESKKHGDSPWHSSIGLASTAYIVCAVLGNALGRATPHSQAEDIIQWIFIVILTLIVALLTRSAQKTANYHNEQILGADFNFRESYVGKVYAGEWIWSALGFLLVALGAFGGFYSISSSTYPQGTESEISVAKDKMDKLTQQYNTCSDSLSTRHDAVDTADQAAIDAYNSDYDDCENVRLQQNNAVTEYNRLAGFKTE